MLDKLLFVARRPPFPLANGARIRSHRLLTGLADAFEVTFLTFEHRELSGEPPLTEAELSRLLPGIRVVTVPGPWTPKRLGQLASIPSPASWEFGRYRSSALARTVRELVGQGIDLVHFDDLGVALAGPAAGPINVYAAHNVEHRIVSATAERSTGMRRRFAAIEVRKVRREEERVWRSMSLCLAVSELDAAAMQAAGARVTVCPNGTDPVDRLSYPRRRVDEPLRLLFVGSVDYQPNFAGIEWLLREVLPLLRRHVPVVLDVVGSRKRPLPAVDGVVYHGQVDSVLPFYEQAHAAVVPVLFGSGTRLKVVEAMALGRPIVATSAGAEGLPISPGQHYLVADDPQSFTAALIRITEDTATSARSLEAMIDAARAAIAHLLWPEIVGRLVQSYRLEIDSRAGPRAPVALKP